jgi:hypothetical protein
MREGGCEMLRGFLCGALITATTIAAADDWPPKLVASFPAPPGALDIALGASYLFALVDGNPPTVYQLKYWSGSIVGSFTVRVPRGARGITYSQYPTRMIYISNRVNGYIYEIPMASSIVSSFVCRVGKPYGLTYSETCRHGTGLFVACRDENLIARMDPSNGLLLSSFAGPAAAVTGFDYCFAVDRYTRFLYWDYYGAWEVIDTLPARLWGVAVGLYGKPYDEGILGHVLCRDGYIYYYDGYIAVAPASLGRVKALFR